MSTNKSKYWEVTTTKIVRAVNKTEAVKAASVRKPVTGTEVLTSLTSADRISAAEAHYFANEMV